MKNHKDLTALIMETRSKRFIVRILSISGLLFMSWVLWVIYKLVLPITFLDRPYFLSDKRETIEVSYIMWSCDCADFIETKYYHGDIREAREGDYIFIEAADSSLIVPGDFYVNGLRLTGEFYRKKGISRTYELKTEEKPEWARVFRYDKMEIVGGKSAIKNYNPKYNK